MAGVAGDLTNHKISRITGESINLVGGPHYSTHRYELWKMSGKVGSRHSPEFAFHMERARQEIVRLRHSHDNTSLECSDEGWCLGRA